MNANHVSALEPKMHRAVAELQALIQSRYPTAQFEVATAPENFAAVHLLTTVDIDETDEVVDPVIERLVQLRPDEGEPILVIPLRTPERVAKLLDESREATAAHPVA